MPGFNSLTRLTVFVLLSAVSPVCLAQGSEVDYSLCLDFIKPTEKNPFDEYLSRYWILNSKGEVSLNGETNKEVYSSMSGGKPVFIGKPLKQVDAITKPGSNRVIRYEITLNKSNGIQYLDDKIIFFKDEAGRVSSLQYYSRNNSGTQADSIYQVNFVFPGYGNTCFPQRVAKQLGRKFNEPFNLQTSSTLQGCRDLKEKAKAEPKCEKYLPAIAKAKGLGDLSYSEAGEPSGRTPGAGFWTR